MDERRSARVRRILQLEGRAAALRARYECTLARVAPARHQSEQLRQQAVALMLTGPDAPPPGPVNGWGRSSASSASPARLPSISYGGCVSRKGCRVQRESVPPGQELEARSLDGRAEGNRSLEAHRQNHRNGWRASHRAATCVNAGPPPKNLSFGGRAHNHRAKAAWGVAVWLTRRLTPTGRERRHDDEGTTRNWRNPPRPTAKAAAAGQPYNQSPWEVGGRREGGGWARSSDEAG